MSSIWRVGHQVRQHTKRIMGVNLSSSTNNSINKSICRCDRCNAYLIVDSAIKDQNRKFIVLDLDQKRHFCCDSDKILHEGHTVEYLQKIIDYTNKRELSSFKLELRIVNSGEEIMSSQEKISSTIEDSYYDISCAVDEIQTKLRKKKN